MTRLHSLLNNKAYRLFDPAVTEKRDQSGTEADGCRWEEMNCPQCLGGFDQVINVDVKVIVVFDIVDGGLGWHLVDDQACSLHARVGNVLHLFPYEALCLLSWLPVCRQQVLVL